MTDKPRSILEAAAAAGFKHVPSHIRNKCLKDLNIGGLRLGHQQSGALINAFRGDWGWSDVDVARAMRHALPDACNRAAPKRRPPPESDVYGQTLRDDIQDIIDAAQHQQALDAAAEAVVPPAAEAAVLAQGDLDPGFVEALEVARNGGSFTCCNKVIVLLISNY